MFVGKKRAIWWWGIDCKVIIEIALRIRDSVLPQPVSVFWLI